MLSRPAGKRPTEAADRRDTPLPRLAHGRRQLTVPALLPRVSEAPALTTIESPISRSLSPDADARVSSPWMVSAAAPMP